MSVAGLKFGPDHGSNRAPVETRSGAFIYHGDAASYHDWEFRTLLRVELLEAQEAASRTAASDPTDGSGVTNGQGDAEEEFPTTAAPPSKPEPSQSRCDPDRDVMRDRYTLVSKIMEGLQGDAFLIARDMGIAALVADQGLRKLCEEGEGELIVSESQRRSKGVVPHRTSKRWNLFPPIK